MPVPNARPVLAPRRIALTNQKGGPGKTTVSVHLAVTLAKLGHACLLLDLDEQGNATKYLGADVDENLMADVILGDADLSSSIVVTEHGVDVVPGGCNLDVAVLPKKGMIASLLLKKRLDTLDRQYDFVFFDCPPNLSLATMSALIAANEVLIPVDEGMALEGMLKLQSNIRNVQEVNGDLRILGLLQTKTRDTEVVTKEVREALANAYGDLVFPVSIPRSPKITQSYNHHKPLHAYDAKSKAGKTALGAFRQLADEVIARGPSA
jgi:chromosome partitioning protein